jgi:hypothetical protein
MITKFLGLNDRSAVSRSSSLIPAFPSPVVTHSEATVSSHSSNCPTFQE